MDVRKNSADVFAMVSNLQSDAGGNILCFTGFGFVTFIGKAAGGVPGSSKFVLFDTGLSASKVSKFVNELRDTATPSGYRIADALHYPAIIILGTRESYSPNERQSLDDAVTDGHTVNFIDPAADDAEEQLRTALTAG